MDNGASKMGAVAAVWHELHTQIASQSILKSDDIPLTDYALGTFKPKLVLERLLDPKPSYFAHKDILFAGLCAWTAGPEHQFLIEEAMVLAGAARLAATEKKRQSELPGAPMLADIVTRVAGPGIDYFQDFYYPAGGLQRIIRTRSPKLMQRSIKAASLKIGFLVELLRVCHDHAESLSDRRRYRTASLISAGQAVSGLIEISRATGNTVNQLLQRVMTNRTVDALNCTKKAASYQHASALIYAAYSIPVEGSDLLAVICNGVATYNKHGHLLGEWAGRASYVAQHVIAPMYTRDSTVGQLDYLSGITPIEFSSPNYGEAAVKVEEAFKIAHNSNL